MEHSDFPFKRPPFQHQLEEWQQSRDLLVRGIFWEMGCGKSKVTIDSLAWLYLDGKIDAVIVLAPNGVHSNWITDELPSHLPDSIPWRGTAYHSSRRTQKRQQLSVEATMAEAFLGLRVLAMTYSGIMTDAGAKLAKKFITKYRCMLVVDESTAIKNPGAKRTIRVLAMAKYAPYRRILTGTPVANGPFDLFSQIKFLDEHFWKKYQIDDYGVFKGEIGVQKTFKNNATGKSFVKTVAYRKLEWLHDIIQPITSRVTKAQALPHLPPKLYTKRRFEMSDEQEKVYAQLSREYRTELDGQRFAVPLAMVRILRLHQVTSNYLPFEDEEGVTHFKEIGKDNPRLDCLSDVVEELAGQQAIIWARFQRDVVKIAERIRTGVRGKYEPRTCTIYHGPCSVREREQAIADFRSGNAQFFVANPACIGMGVTLTEATSVVYYNNSFVYPDRLQSEDRAHRIGQKNAVNYIDIIAEGTVDDKIVNALRTKLSIANIITGDNFKEWI